MGERNQTSWTEFILVGFSDVPHLRVLLFVVFLLIYLVTVAGNLLVMFTVYSDSRLHTAMYFFLSNLAFVDICYISITFPRMLANFFLQGAHITFLECLMQVHFYISLIIIEFFLLTIMAYDRYTAICNPLRYTEIMNKSVCAYMVTGAWVLGLLAPTTHTSLISKIYFCESNKINHLFCDLVALLHLACSTTVSIDLMTYFLGITIPITSFIFIITSYANIISAVLKIQSSTGRQKAFSTCASHLIAVILFCGILLFNDMRPASMYSVNQNKISSLVYVAVSPMCNPIIYTLKNKEFQNTLQRIRNAFWVG